MPPAPKIPKPYKKTRAAKPTMSTLSPTARAILDRTKVALAAIGLQNGYR